MSTLRRTDIARAIAGAIAGGLAPGSFAVEISRSGAIRILPAANVSRLDADELDAELEAWRNAQKRKTA